MMLLVPIFGICLLLQLPGIRRFRAWPSSADKAAISMGISFALVGILHFVKPLLFQSVIPGFMPAKLFVVYFTGVLEILGGLATLVLPRQREWISWGLIAFLLAVFPANILLALNHGTMGIVSMSPLRAWLRLPVQFVFIGWTWWGGRSARSWKPPTP